MTETIYLGAGCFWCVDVLYRELNGVASVESGYAGGSIDNPSYQQICSGKTGYAEVIKVQFESEIISLDEILEIFFVVHDPTQLNRQGNDVGTQYRSVIFYSNEEQKRVAEGVMRQTEEANIWDRSIVTEISGNTKYYTAEEYHQNYYNLNAEQPYCKFIIEPKVAKFRKMYLDKLKK